MKHFGLLIDKQCNLDSWATTHLACANEKTTNFYFFLLSPRFLLQSYARMFQVEQFHIGGVVTSGFIASKLFLFLTHPWKHFYFFSLSLLPPWTNWTDLKQKIEIFLSFSWSLSVNFETDFNLSLTQFFCKKKVQGGHHFDLFVFSFKIYFFEDKVKIGFQSVVK